MARWQWRRLRVNTYSNGGTALAAFEVNPLPFEAGRRWRLLRLTHTLCGGTALAPTYSNGGTALAAFEFNPLSRDGVGGI